MEIPSSQLRGAIQKLDNSSHALMLQLKVSHLQCGESSLLKGKIAEKACLMVVDTGASYISY